MNSIFKRRSIRKYEEKPVENEKIHLLLKAAMSAPTARNQREWEFVVVTDRRSSASCRRQALMRNRRPPRRWQSCL